MTGYFCTLVVTIRIMGSVTLHHTIFKNFRPMVFWGVEKGSHVGVGKGSSDLYYY